MISYLIQCNFVKEEYESPAALQVHIKNITKKDNTMYFFRMTAFSRQLSLALFFIETPENTPASKRQLRRWVSSPSKIHHITKKIKNKKIQCVSSPYGRV